MKEKAELYIEAAKIIAMCPANRLELVLDVLKMGGIEIERIEEVMEELRSKGKATIYETSRRREKKDLWVETDSAAALMLRKAYDKNISLTAIANLSGVHRVSLYRYMTGKQKPSKYVGDKIMIAINNIFSNIGEGAE